LVDDIVVVVERVDVAGIEVVVDIGLVAAR
jgi:hypothetical protein